MANGNLFTSLVIELSVLQEVNSITTADSVENLIDDVSEKASRLLGCRRFAMVKELGVETEILGTWGFSNHTQVLEILASRKENVFLFSFCIADEPGKNTVIFENSSIIDDKQSKLYTILSRRIEEILTSNHHRQARENAENNLRESKRYYNNVLSSVNDGIFVLNEEYTIQYANRYLNDLFQSSKPLKGCKCHEVFFSSEKVCENCPVSHSISLGNPERAVFKGFPDTNLKWIEVYSAPLLSGKGDLNGYVQSIRDISEQKTLERDLNQIQKLDAVNTLTTGVAHEFNNILQAVTGYSEYHLMKMDRDNPLYENMRNILDFGRRGSDLVNKILAFSRKTDTKQEIIDLNDRLTHIVQVLRKTIPKMIDVVMNLDPELWSTMADTTQIEQIIFNLAGNAVDAMPDGGRLVFETKNTSLDNSFCNTHLNLSPGNYIQLTVSDSGTGMNEKISSKIFEPFFTTKEIGKGTGLGLSAVFGIVSSLNGRIFCYSEEGTGTTFTIYLPAYESVEVHVPAEHSQNILCGGTETILVVDDEDRIRNLTGSILTEMGYSVQYASNGEEALEVYRKKKHTIDIVVLDLGMPGMGGYECLKKLLNINPSLKILIVSGYTSANSLVSDSVREGASGFIGKPYRVTDLARKVRAILDGHSN